MVAYAFVTTLKGHVTTQNSILNFSWEGLRMSFKAPHNIMITTCGFKALQGERSLLHMSVPVLQLYVGKRLFFIG